MAARFLLLDARTLTPQAEVSAVDSVTFTEVLNGPGSFKATIPLLQPDLYTLTASMILPPNAIFAVEKDDVLVQAGWVWAHDYNVNDGVVGIAGEGVLSVLRRRVYRRAGTFLAASGWEQEEIAWDIINWSQTQYRGNLGITDRHTPSNVFRDRIYNLYERRYIGEMIEELAKVDNGFDFRFTPHWTAGPNSTIGWWFDTTYPATGRTTDLAFQLGANADVPSATLDGTNIAYTVDVLGQGQGSYMPLNTQWNMAALSGNILLDDVISQGNISDTATLEAYAKRRLTRGSAPISIPKIDVDPGLLGTIVIGDRVSVDAEYGLLSLSGQYRVTQYDFEIPADGPERFSLSLAPLEVF